MAHKRITFFHRRIAGNAPGMQLTRSTESGICRNRRSRRRNEASPERGRGERQWRHSMAGEAQSLRPAAARPLAPRTAAARRARRGASGGQPSTYRGAPRSPRRATRSTRFVARRASYRNAEPARQPTRHRTAPAVTRRRSSALNGGQAPEPKPVYCAVRAARPMRKCASACPPALNSSTMADGDLLPRRRSKWGVRSRHMANGQAASRWRIVAVKVASIVDVSGVMLRLSGRGHLAE